MTSVWFLKCMECGRVYSLDEHGASDYFCSYACLHEWQKPCEPLDNQVPDA